MANGTATNEWLGDLVHLDRGLDARVYPLLLECVLKSERIDHGCEHSHVIGGNTIHVLGLHGDAAEEIAPAHDDREFHAKTMNVCQFGRDFVDAFGINSEPLLGG